MNKIIILIFLSISLFGKDILIDKGEFKVIYSVEYKGPVLVSYELDKRVSEGNIKKRPSFYKEPLLSYEEGAVPSDYTNTGFDRGHIASHASFDYSEEVLNKTYSMANIALQYPEVNRKVWLSIEEMERYNTVQFGKLYVENRIVYGDEILKKKAVDETKGLKYKIKYQREAEALEKKKIRIPIGFYKKMVSGEFKECYYVENKEDIKKKDIKEYLVPCNF